MADVDRLDLTIVVPVRNDAGIVRSVLEGIWRALEHRPPDSWEILVVDDASGDDTCAEVLSFAVGHPRVLLLHNPGALGCGYAVRHGIHLSRGEKIALLSPDPDLPLAELHRLERALGERHDMAVYSPRIRVERAARPVLIRREVLRSAVRAPIRAVRGEEAVRRPHLFQIFRRRAALELFRRQRLTSASFTVEVLYLARRYGYSVIEIGPSSTAPALLSTRFREAESSVGELLRIRMHRLRGDYG